ncbi:MAG: hypothetical protein QG626_178 [Patescibacteria group bacterium]|jgi:NADH dehydrogenase|nr:hypothetical protein [Patescibacteria group bacterium]
MPAKLKKVVILGGGFAGLVTARRLVRAGVVDRLCEVTVIDAHDAHVYTPWLYEAASCALDGETRATKERMLGKAHLPYATLPGFSQIRFVRSVIQLIDTQTKYVNLERGRKMPFDILVIALGAESNYFGVPGLPEHAFTLKHFEDAKKIHDATERLFDVATARQPKYIVIAGAGPNGMEFVSELAHTLRALERRAKIQYGAVKIALVDPSPELFTVLPPALRVKAVRRFERLGVELRAGLRVAEVTKGTVKAFTATGKSTDTLELPADLCIWSAGIKMSPLIQLLPFLKDDRGRIVLENTYQVAGHPGIFAAGDCASLINPHTKKADPQSAQVAHYQAHDLARNIVSFLEGKPLYSARLPKRWAFFSALGGHYAAGTLGGIRFSGRIAFWLRRFADLYYFLALLPVTVAVRFWLDGVRLYGKNDR